MNNEQNDNRAYAPNTGPMPPYQQPMFTDGTDPQAQIYQGENQNYSYAQQNVYSTVYSEEPPLVLRNHEDHVWFKPEKYSNRSIGIQVGNDYHQVFVYEDESNKNELVGNSLTNNCRFPTSSPYYMYSTQDGMRFRSQGEVHIYFALKETGYLFYANSRVTTGPQTKEPDFSVIHKGKVYILDVLNKQTHDSEQDAKNVRFYQGYGVPVRSYTTEECVKDPIEVVNDFLQWVQQQN